MLKKTLLYLGLAVAAAGLYYNHTGSIPGIAPAPSHIDIPPSEANLKRVHTQDGRVGIEGTIKNNSDYTYQVWIHYEGVDSQGVQVVNSMLLLTGTIAPHMTGRVANYLYGSGAYGVAKFIMVEDKSWFDIPGKR